MERSDKCNVCGDRRWGIAWRVGGGIPRGGRSGGTADGRGGKVALGPSRCLPLVPARRCNPHLACLAYPHPSKPRPSNSPPLPHTRTHTKHTHSCCTHTHSCCTQHTHTRCTQHTYSRCTPTLKSGSGLPGPSAQGEEKVFHRASGELRFRPRVVRSVPRASVVRSGSAEAGGDGERGVRRSVCGVVSVGGGGRGLGGDGYKMARHGWERTPGGHGKGGGKGGERVTE
jgi:hypothetical protein